MIRFVTLTLALLATPALAEVDVDLSVRVIETPVSERGVAIPGSVLRYTL